MFCVFPSLNFSDGTLGSVFSCRMSLNVQSVSHTGILLIPLAVVLITELVYLSVLIKCQIVVQVIIFYYNNTITIAAS